MRWSVLPLALLVACSAGVEPLGGGLGDELGGAGNGSGNGNGNGNGGGGRPKGSGFDVTLEDSRRPNAWLLIHDAAGSLLLKHRMARGETVEVRDPTAVFATLAEIELDGSCHQLSTLDTASSSESIVYAVAPVQEDIYIADFVIGLPPYSPVVYENWVGIGCGGEYVHRNAINFVAQRACVRPGGDTKAVVVGYDRDGHVAGWALDTLRLRSSRVEGELDGFVTGNRRRQFRVENQPPEAKSGTFVLRGLGNGFSTRGDFAFDPSVPAAMADVSFMDTTLPVRATVEYEIEDQVVVAHNVSASSFETLPPTIDAGGDFPIIQDVRLTARHRPLLEWEVVGPDAGIDGAILRYAWDAQTRWEVRTTQPRSGGFRFLELPPELAVCQPDTVSPRASITVFDTDAPELFDRYATGEKIENLASRYTTFAL